MTLGDFTLPKTTYANFITKLNILFFNLCCRLIPTNTPFFIIILLSFSSFCRSLNRSSIKFTVKFSKRFLHIKFYCHFSIFVSIPILIFIRIEFCLLDSVSLTVCQKMLFRPLPREVCLLNWQTGPTELGWFDLEGWGTLEMPQHVETTVHCFLKLIVFKKLNILINLKIILFVY